MDSLHATLSLAEDGTYIICTVTGMSTSADVRQLMGDLRAPFGGASQDEIRDDDCEARVIRLHVDTRHCIYPQQFRLRCLLLPV